MFDLKLIPIHQEHGQPVPQKLGFLAASPPRRAARSRAEDCLILSFIVNGGGHLPDEKLEAWLAHLVETFFKTSGSVTSALRAQIETLNLTLMENNLKSAGEAAAATGAINLAAIHHRAVYIAQSGLTHAYALTRAGLTHFYDSSRMDRGLGMSRTPTIRYYQAELGEGGYLFMSSTPPETWIEDQLCKDGFPNLEQLRRRLLNQASPHLRLDLVQILPGEGRVDVVQAPIQAPEPVKQVEPVPAQADDYVLPEESLVDDLPSTELVFDDTQKVPQVIEDEQTDVLEPEISVPTPEPESDDVLEEPDELLTVEEPQDAVDSHPFEDVHQAQEHHPEVPVEAPVQPKPNAPRPARKSISQQLNTVREEGLQWMAGFFAWWGKARADAGNFFRTRFSRAGAEDGAGLPELSVRTSLMIAIAVPLVVVGIALGVYLSRGRALQYQSYLEQAQLAVASAGAQGDPNLARDAYTQAILFLEQAQGYRRSDEITQLMTDSQRALDVLDGAARLSFHPAIMGVFSDQINITRIISYGLDLYLLDAAGGQVIHATRASQGYQVDATFMCRAGNFSGGAVDALVDMAPLPINNPYQAHILAADAIGNVIFCGPGRDPVVQSLPPGEGVFGAVTRIATEGSLLYALDPSADTVRVYRSTNGQFLDAPTAFFGGAAEGEKFALGPIVDLAVNGAELYFLRSDGRMVSCVASGLPGNPVTCENPVAYVDGRPGKEDQPVTMPEARFAAIQYTTPPDPAINILDADNADIFRLSLRFRLYQRMRSDFGNYEVLSPAATAFTIGVDRIAFIAFGHQVFYAYVE